MKYIKTFEDINPYNIKFVVDNRKFKLVIGRKIITESGFSIEEPDKYFNEKYVTLYDLKTIEDFQNKGFAKYLLKEIFNYVKNNLGINIITLIVYKDNIKAINLYLKYGFEIYIEYDDNSYSLIKNL